MTHKYMFDESSQALHRVAGFGKAWEQIGPGVRVRRRRIKPLELEKAKGVASWVLKLGTDYDGAESNG